jgi:uncharacterized membrane protein YhaH (DUF805 family)
VNNYFKVLRTFSFAGRARRAEYWQFVILNALAQIALRFLSMAFGLVLNVDDAGAFVLNNNLTEDSTALLELIYSVLVLIQSIAVNVRRFHDRGLSGWWLAGALGAMAAAGASFVIAPAFRPAAMGVIAVVGLALFVISVLPGTSGPNKYGADPKGEPGDVAEAFT